MQVLSHFMPLQDLHFYQIIPLKPSRFWSLQTNNNLNEKDGISFLIILGTGLRFCWKESERLWFTQNIFTKFGSSTESANKPHSKFWNLTCYISQKAQSFSKKNFSVNWTVIKMNAYIFTLSSTVDPVFLWETLFFKVNFCKNLTDWSKSRPALQLHWFLA